MKNKKSKKKMSVAKIEDKLFGLNQTLISVTAEPDQYLIEHHAKYNEIQQMLQKIYGITIEMDQDNQGNPDILAELVVDEMDEEQIWQQLELRNGVIINDLIEQTANLMALREQKLEVHLKEKDENNTNGEVEDDHEEECDKSVSDDDEGESEAGRRTNEVKNESDASESEDKNLFKPKPKQNSGKNRKSVVDDQFFKLEEMEQFLEAAEKQDEKKAKGKLPSNDDDGINYFAEDLGGDGEEDSDEEKLNPNYKDFFDIEEDEVEDVKQNTKKDIRKNQKDQFMGKDELNDGNDIDDEDIYMQEKAGESDNDAQEDEDENDVLENAYLKSKDYGSRDDHGPDEYDSDVNEDKTYLPKSSFEMKQSRLEQRIHDYEEEVLDEKPWQLKGEIQATNRPQNSILEEVLEFESTVRPVPIITEETTRRLEDIIRQRVKAKAWDDVERIAKPLHNVEDYRKLLVLDQEKSKESLAHIYEKEYQRELEKLYPNHESNDSDEPKEHKEIRKLMRELFIKLDALSNFHFTPKPVAPEPKIMTNSPAVAMEEVAPVAVSDSKLLAPEEVFHGPKRELVGKSEKNKTDKNRALRQKKSKQRAIQNALNAKDLQKQKMGIPLSKKEESAKLIKKLTKQRNVEKITSSNDQGAVKSSKAFFSKLQDQSTTTGNTMKPNKKKHDAESLSAKRLKL